MKENSLAGHHHFKEKDAIGHVAEVQVRGIVNSNELHGTELSGSLFAAADAARETVVNLTLLFVLLSFVPLPFNTSFKIFILYSLGLLIWKAGRSGWLGWIRLEQLHKILEEEKWEIDNNREQEREELTALYAAKGFKGQLLEDVINVLMADGDRLLRVMLQEELGLSLESQEHPLKQSLGAALGVFASSVLWIGTFAFLPPFALMFPITAILALSALFYAKFQKNRLIPAIIWNLGIAFLALCSVYFFSDYF